MPPRQQQRQKAQRHKGAKAQRVGLAGGGNLPGSLPLPLCALRTKQLPVFTWRAYGGVLMFTMNWTSMMAGIVPLAMLPTSASAASGWGDSEPFFVNNQAGIPTISEWSLVILALAVLTAGTLALRRRQRLRRSLPLHPQLHQAVFRGGLCSALAGTSST